MVQPVIWTADLSARCQATIARHSQPAAKECLEWTASRKGSGKHGQMRFAGQTGSAHRWAYMVKMQLPEIPTGQQVRHLCGNGLCVNSDHLTLGTPRENAADTIAHGTSSHGRNSELTEATIRGIKFGEGTQKERAERFRVSIVIVQSIDRRESWVWVGKTAEQNDRTAPSQATVRKRKLVAIPETWTCEDYSRATKFVSQRHAVEPSTDCHLWKQSLTAEGYGRACFKDKVHKAHRLSFMAFNRCQIPKDKVVRHKCTGARHCVNPQHLELGTAADNAKDRTRDGTQVRMKGTAHPMCTITEETAIAIKKSRGNGSMRERAIRFNTTQPIVCAIDNGKAWKHI